MLIYLYGGGMMGLLDRFIGKKNEANHHTNNTDNMNNTKNITSVNAQTDKKAITNEDINRLGQVAESIINKIVGVFTTPNGIDSVTCLLYSAGLAGHACYCAVKTLSPSLFTVVEYNNGNKYYFGDAVNKYLLEGQYSVLSFCQGMYVHMAQGEPIPDVDAIVKNMIDVLGAEEVKIWDRHKLGSVYKEICDCWNDIHHTMVEANCNSAEEWPILYGIVLSNIMKIVMQVAPKDLVFKSAIECAYCISKIGEDSIRI